MLCIAFAWSVPSYGTLIHFWSLDGASDTADNTGSATLVSGGGGGIANGTDRFGNATSAIALDGSSGSWFSTTLSNPSGINSSFTFTAWVRSTDSLRFRRVVEANSFLSGSILSQAEATLPGNNTDLFMFVVDAANGTDFTNDPRVPLNTNEWVQLVGTYDQSLATNNARLYLNGTTIAVGTPDQNNPNIGGQSFFIGANNTNGDRWIGSLDEASVWNSALSDTYVKALHGVSAENGLQYDPAHASDLFTLFEQGSGSALVDGKTWHYTTGLGGGAGDLDDLGGGDYALTLDGSGAGVTTIPEPSAGILVLIGIAGLLFRLKSRMTHK